MMSATLAYLNAEAFGAQRGVCAARFYGMGNNLLDKSLVLCISTTPMKDPVATGDGTVADLEAQNQRLRYAIKELSRLSATRNCVGLDCEMVGVGPDGVRS